MILDSIKVAFLKQFRHVKVFAWPMFIVFNPHTYTVKGNHYYEARKLIQPGDILLRGYTQYLDGYFVPGTYSHAAMYIGGEHEQIVHAMTPEVQWTNLCTFMRCDRFAIIRANVSKADTKLAIKRATSLIGIPYDYDFVFETKDSITKRQFSCSELCYYAYQKNLAKLNWAIKEHSYIFFTKALFTPDDCLPTENSSSTLIYKK